jgi:hypothetical protein
MRRIHKLYLALFFYLGAAVTWADAIYGGPVGDPDWFNWRDVFDWTQITNPLGVHHESLFVLGILIGTGFAMSAFLHRQTRNLVVTFFAVLGAVLTAFVILLIVTGVRFV